MYRVEQRTWKCNAQSKCGDGRAVFTLYAGEIHGASRLDPRAGKPREELSPDSPATVAVPGSADLYAEGRRCRPSVSGALYRVRFMNKTLTRLIFSYCDSLIGQFAADCYTATQVLSGYAKQ